MKRFLLLLIVMTVSAVATADEGEMRVRETLTTLRGELPFPGATVAWVDGDGQLHSLAVGDADPATNKPMTPDNRMLAASIGKSFLAAAILSLVEEGKLELDAPVSRWLADRDWFAHLPHHGKLTLRHLLTHSGGLPDHVQLPAFHTLFLETRENDNPPGPVALIQLLADTEPAFAPGRGWAYSDTGYLVAARVLEASTSKPWTTVVKRRFLSPLGLDDTVASNRRKIPRLAAGITAADNPFGLPPRTLDERGRLLWHPGIEDAGGGYASTASDLARWGRQLWSGRLHSGSAFQEMLRGVPVGEERPGVSYGLGVVIEQSESGGEIRSHRGWIPGYVSSLRYFPAFDTAIAIQINADVDMMGEAGNFLAIEDAVTRTILAHAERQTHPALDP